MTLTPSAIQKIGRLSRLKLTDEDVAYHQENLENIFKWIDQLQLVDVSGVELDIDASSPLMHERIDQVTAVNRMAEVLSNAPSSAHDMYAVPKVVE